MNELAPYLLIFVSAIALLGWLAFIFGKKKGFAQNVERVNFLEAKFNEKAEEVASVKFALEKARYELIKLASEMNEMVEQEETYRQIAAEKDAEIKNLKKELTVWEKNNGKNSQPETKTVRSKQKKFIEKQPEIIDLPKKRKKVA